MQQEDTSQRAGGEKAAWNIPFLNPTSKFTLMQELEAAQEGRAAAGEGWSSAQEKERTLERSFCTLHHPMEKTREN